MVYPHSPPCLDKHTCTFALTHTHPHAYTNTNAHPYTQANTAQPRPTNALTLTLTLAFIAYILTHTPTHLLTRPESNKKMLAL